MSVEAVQKKPSVQPLTVTRMPTRSNVRRVEWDVYVTPETKLEDILDPVWWSHIAGSTFQGQTNYVDVHWDDKSQLARLYVRQYTGSAAKVAVLGYWNFDEEDDLPPSDKYEVKWSGPHTKFRVIRKQDNQLIRDGLESKSDAAAFIETLPK